MPNRLVPIALLALVTAEASAQPAQVLVTFDRAGERRVASSGWSDPQSARVATADDPVRIASISKLVTAIGVMRLVEQGRLDLDRPIADYLGYRVVNPAFPNDKISLRRLLSHTSSLRDHDDQYAIPLGETLKAVLDDPQSWDRTHGPGDGYFVYANVNFPVVASVLERVTGTRFDQLMQRLVLAPMKLDACFNWPGCSDHALARAVVLTQDGVAVRDDLKGKRPDCPVFVREGRPCALTRYVPGDNGALFAPQGGLRISARDLARVGRMFANGGSIDGTRILSTRSIRQMSRPAWRWNGRNGQTEGGIYCRFGLSVHLLATRKAGCRDDPGLPPGDWLGHSGEAYGLRSGLWIDRHSGRGMAYFTTGVSDAAAGTRSAFTMPEEAQVEQAVR